MDIQFNLYLKNLPVPYVVEYLNKTYNFYKELIKFLTKTEDSDLLKRNRHKNIKCCGNELSKSCLVFAPAIYMFESGCKKLCRYIPTVWPYECQKSIKTKKQMEMF